MPWSLRPAVPGDAGRIAAVLNEGFDGYRSFAPPGWAPPAAEAELERFGRFLGSGVLWGLVAEEDNVIAGHVAFMPSRIHPQPSDDDSMAHFWQLFVRERWWGTGLATALHAEAVREAGGPGFTSMRLFTPPAPAPPPPFYQREGSSPAKRASRTSARGDSGTSSGVPCTSVPSPARLASPSPAPTGCQSPGSIATSAPPGRSRRAASPKHGPSGPWYAMWCSTSR